MVKWDCDPPFLLLDHIFIMFYITCVLTNTSFLYPNNNNNNNNNNNSLVFGDPLWMKTNEICKGEKSFNYSNDQIKINPIWMG